VLSLALLALLLLSCILRALLPEESCVLLEGSDDGVDLNEKSGVLAFMVFEITLEPLCSLDAALSYGGGCRGIYGFELRDGTDAKYRQYMWANGIPLRATYERNAR
jgi:hypothetical protein